jgi:exoribonuclease R
MSIKLLVNDRNYQDYSYCDSETFRKVETEGTLCIHPIEAKLFHNDIFTIDKEGIVNMLHSTVRKSQCLAGVLILHGNRTYGVASNGKRLYKCIPDDKHLPAFLVPYEMKHVGFSKNFINMYVTFSFQEWNHANKHPIGIIIQVIGTVDVLSHFYEYQLYCKNINTSIQKFTKDASKALGSCAKEEQGPHETFMDNICQKFPKIVDRTDKKEWDIFTIDPEASLDWDDGFSFKSLEDGTCLLSIYISNVTIWLDVLNLWDSFSRRISTIYLPDRKRPMLPTILSDCLCSLQSNTTRIAFVMDIFVKDDEIERIEYHNCKINVNRNFVYESKSLLEYPSYAKLMHATKRISKKIKFINQIQNSHDIVTYLMILMNYYCATELLKSKNGIFRSTIIKKDIEVPENIPPEVSKYIKIWSTSYGNYIDGSSALLSNMRHELLEMDAYVHITSPIRRLVDLLNMICLQRNLGLVELSSHSVQFYESWLQEMDYINTTMRAIRRVQTDCNLLDICSSRPDILDKEYECYLFDKLERNDGLYLFVVYLPKHKLICRLVLRDDLPNFSKCMCRLYIFEDEDKFKKKIRLQIIS